MMGWGNRGRRFCKKTIPEPGTESFWSGVINLDVFVWEPEISNECMYVSRFFPHIITIVCYVCFAYGMGPISPPHLYYYY